MIKMPYEQLLEKLVSGSGLSRADVEKKIKEKMDKLSGLISKEGAAQIVANELSIKLYETGRVKVKDVLPGMRSVETAGKVVQIYEVRNFVTNGREGKVGSFLMGDESGSVRVVLWGDQADQIAKLSAGSIVKIKDAYVRENMNGRKELHLNANSNFIINPQGIEVQEVKKQEAIRKRISELTETDLNVDIVGTIVQVFEPRFFEVCPECSKRARGRDGVYVCDTHGSVQPRYSHVMNVFLDDGMDNIRAVLFREQALKLTDKTEEQFLAYKDIPENFDEIKNELLGTIVKLTGKVSKNDMFQRIEFVARDVEKNIKVDDEIAQLDAEIKKVQEKSAAKSM